jgi:hypothetical protein
MAANDFLPVYDVANQLGITWGRIHAWAREGKVPAKTSSDGLRLVSLSGVKAYREKFPGKPRKKAPAGDKPAQEPPAQFMEQATKFEKIEGCLKVFFPSGISVKQYMDVLVLVKALETAVGL